MAFRSWFRKPVRPEPSLETEAVTDVGPFIGVFRSSGYLNVMGMVSSDATRQVLQSIDTILSSTPSAPSYIEGMLRDRNYRHHLVAVGAILLSREPAAYASALWTTFDRGSWVAPQLAVSLYWSDPSFAWQARRRIAARCPIDNSDNFFRGDTRVPCAKNLASLLQVMSFIPGQAGWVASERQAKDVRRLLEADYDSVGTIAERWFDGARKCFGEFGRTLIAARPHDRADDAEQ